MRIKSLGIDVVISPLMLPMLAAIFFMRQLDTYMVVFVCALIHELAHITAASKYKIEVEAIEVLPVGLVARTAKIKGIPLMREIIIYISGPLINIVLASVAALLKYGFNFLNNELIEKLILINILLALVNLLPIIPLDGGKILHAVLSSKIGYIKVSNICIVLSKAVCVIILVPSIVILGYTGNFSILILCIFILIYATRYDGILKVETLADIIYKKEVLIKKKIIKIEVVAAHLSVELIELVKRFNLNKLYFVMVLDDHLKTVGIVNEVEIIDYIIRNNSSAYLYDLISDNISKADNWADNQG